MKSINKILFSEAKPYAWKLFLILFLVVAGVGFGVITPWPFKVLIDNVLGSENFEKTTLLGKFLSTFRTRELLGFFIVIVYFLSSIMKEVMEYVSNALTKKVSRSVVHEFAQKTFESMEQMSIGYFKKQSTGDYLYRLSYDVSAFGNLLEDGLLPIASNFLYMAVTLAILFFVDVKLALISMAIIPVLALGLRTFNRKIDVATVRSERSNSLLFSFIEEVLNQLKNIQAFNQEKRQAAIFNVKEGSSLTEELNVYGLGFLMNAMIGVVIAIGYSMVLVYGIHSVFLGDISTGLLIVFIFYLDNLTYPLIALLSAITSFREQYYRVSRMSEFFAPQFHVQDTGRLTKIDETSIIFDNVSVFGDEGVPILDDVSFTIPAGKKTVIVGVSGSGKTTIASLILRFLEPDKGKILIGGKDIRNYTVKSLRQNVSYVPQEIALFNDTIQNNVTFSNPGILPGEIKEAVKSAVANSFISQIPQSYDFSVGKEGTNLSGGQRQRILLARAFLKTQAPVLIFDEPISSLDIKTREQVLDNIDHFVKNKTAIIISNVLRLVHGADYVVVLNEGKLLYKGTSAKLKEESGLARLILHA